ncbi:MAG: hypothetical protein ACP5HG_16140 [Anaerolineae bacterium]
MFDNLLAKGFTVFAQAMVKIQPIWDKYKALIMLIVGLLIGWFLLGYGLFPVQWTDATPGHLHEQYRSAYLAFSAEEFYRTGDVGLLQSRLGLDLATRPGVRIGNIPWLANESKLTEDLEAAIERAPQYELESYLSGLTGLQQIATQDEGILIPEEAPAEEGAAPTSLARILRIVGIAAVVLLVVGAAGVIWYLVAAKPKERVTADVPAGARGTVPEAAVTTTTAADQPVKSFSTPYVLGDDYFDPSFSIEIGTDFLGECGIGISETLGAGDPKKVTAFEAWLFDKSDIRTVTKVLASEYAYNDPDLRAKLEPKGEVVMLRPGEEVVLETTALRIKARIRELEYAQGANLPPNSFVQKINFELQSWVKQVDAAGIEEDYG